MEPFLQGAIATAGSAILGTIVVLFLTAFLAVSAVDIAVSRLVPSSQLPQFSRFRSPPIRRRGAASSLCAKGNESEERWIAVEKAAVFDRLLEISQTRCEEDDDENSGDACVICLKELADSNKGRGVYTMHCEHQLHYVCDMRFLTLCSNRCPTCNADVLGSKEFEKLECYLGLFIPSSKD